MISSIFIFFKYPSNFGKTHLNFSEKGGHSVILFLEIYNPTIGLFNKEAICTTAVSGETITSEEFIQKTNSDIVFVSKNVKFLNSLKLSFINFAFLQSSREAVVIIQFVILFS